MVEVINFDTSDFAEVNLKLRKSLSNPSALKSRLLIMTPSLAVKMQEKGLFAGLGSCHSAVIDKVDLLSALDFGVDLKKLTVFTPSYRCIMTTTDQRVESEKTAQEVEEYKEIKKTFMGQDKALVIKLNHDVN
jgi:hypothetical protein